MQICYKTCPWETIFNILLQVRCSPWWNFEKYNPQRSATKFARSPLEILLEHTLIKWNFLLTGRHTQSLDLFDSQVIPIQCAALTKSLFHLEVPLLTALKTGAWMGFIPSQTPKPVILNHTLPTHCIWLQNAQGGHTLSYKARSNRPRKTQVLPPKAATLVVPH